MTRIAVITPILPIPEDRTRGRYIYEISRELAKLADVRIYLTQPRYILGGGDAVFGEVGPEFHQEGLMVESVFYPAIPVLSRATNGIANGRRLLPKLKEYRPDVILAYWVYPEGNAAEYCARRLRIPCVVGALGSDIHVRTGISRALTRRTILRANALITVSEAMRRVAIAQFGAVPERVHTIVNGFNTSVFGVRPRVDARQKLGVTPEGSLIVYVGRLVEAKGLKELLAAFQYLSGRDQALRLALVGDGPMKEELRTLVDSMGITDRVSMPGGVLPEMVAQWITAGDVLTLPSWSEGYPNVVVEAIACGRPVVASNVGGIPEIISDLNGVLVPPRDPVALAARLRDALDRHWDPDEIAATVRRTWTDVAMETLQVCRKLLPKDAG